MKTALRVLALWTLGIALYALCIDVFGGYPHTETLTRVALIALILGGVGVWRWHARVGEPDPDDTSSASASATATSRGPRD